MNQEGERMKQDTFDPTRREAFAAVAGLGLLGLAPPVADAATFTGGKLPQALLDALEDGEARREMVARIEGDTRPGTQIHGWGSGVCHGVREGEALRPLFGYDVFSSIRLLRQPGGDFQRLCREVIFYRDLESGEYLDEWTNVYSGERVAVVDVANDPFNYIVTRQGVMPGDNGFAGNTAAKPVRHPERWYYINESTLCCDRDAHLFYPSLLDPKVWVRESSGAMNRVSEFMRMFIRVEDLLNPQLTHLPYFGSWVRVTPWLPWMLMDGTPGHCLYVGSISTRRSITSYSPGLQQRIAKRYPHFANAPEAWGGRSRSSLETYVETHKPAPPRSK